jgi:hypothetical protein
MSYNKHLFGSGSAGLGLQVIILNDLTDCGGILRVWKADNQSGFCCQY